MPPKRPRDANQLAKSIIDAATGQTDRPVQAEKDAKAVSRGKLGGPSGGRARAPKLTPVQRAEIAKVAAHTRWKKSG